MIYFKQYDAIFCSNYLFPVQPIFKRVPILKVVHFLVLIATTMFLTACGTLTGIPSHGGGKRFAVEQELVAASARAAVKDMDLRALKGRKVAVHISAMGDQGSGVLTGGRYSIDALIRGDYANSPDVRTEYTYPTYDTTATTTADDLSSSTISKSILNAPSFSRTRSSGGGGNANIGFNINGMGNYANETLTTNPKDASFLSNLISTVFFLHGLDIVPPEMADTDVFVHVDVFGTIRSRTELHVYNAETLRAQTKLEYFAVDRQTRKTVIPPKTAAFEAQYKENYALWTGPLKVQKSVKATDSLMVDFSDVEYYGDDVPAPQPNYQATSSETPSSDENINSSAYDEPRIDTNIIRKRQNNP